jgi:hypothetical protein
LGAAGVVAPAGELAGRDRRWTACGRFVLAPAAWALGTVLVLAPFALAVLGDAGQPMRLWPLGRPAMACGATFLATAVALRRLPHMRRLTQRAAVLVACGVAFWLAFVLVVLPTAERYKPAAPLAQTVNRRAGRDVPIFVCGSAEPSLQFYFGRTRVETLTPRALTEWSRQPSPAVVIVERRCLREAERINRAPLPLRRITRRNGVNYSKGEWCELIALGRCLPWHGPARGVGAAAFEPRRRGAVGPDGGDRR